MTGDKKPCAFRRRAAVPILSGFLLVTTHCLGTDTEKCDWGVVCPSGNVCYEPTRQCVRSEWIEACRGVADLQFCSFEGSGPNYRCRNGVCLEPYCGDGVVDEAEGCDDGNNDDNDACSAQCKAETLVWEETSTASGPETAYADMVFDHSRQRLVLFGGTTIDGSTVGVESNKTWEYDGETWTEIASSSPPEPRRSHAMTYDSHRNRVVLFGGTRGITYFDDTWEYDGETWINVNPAASPLKRWLSAMTYDSERRRIILFGGGFGLEALGDTWAYDGQTWAEIQTETSPPPRGGHRMAYDARRGRVVLFGGASYERDFGDTWEYDSENWVETTPDPSPSPRSNAAMDYHPGSGRTILFGGQTREGQTFLPLGDTWEYDGQNWTEVDTAGGPHARTVAAMAYFPVRRAMVLVGGIDGSNTFSDAWTLIYRNTDNCGDGIVDPGEGCDTTEFGGLSCYLLGFSGGALTCTAECRVDQERCYICGDGLVEPGESCDGSDLAGQTCGDFGFGGGTLSCRADCGLDLSGCF